MLRLQPVPGGFGITLRNVIKSDNRVCTKWELNGICFLGRIIIVLQLSLLILWDSHVHGFNGE